MERVFIFDLDGTVLDTLEDIGLACNFALKEQGYPEHPVADYALMVGNGFLMLVKRALPKGLKLSEEAFLSVVNTAKEAYTKGLCVKTKPHPQMEAVLEELDLRGCKLSVLSNKPEPLTQKLIAHYFPKVPFHPVYGGRSDYPLKPDPTRLLQIISELKVKKEDCYFVGDSQVDMETASRAGLLALGASWGFRGAKELLQFGASHLLLDASDLLKFI